MEMEGQGHVERIPQQRVNSIAELATASTLPVYLPVALLADVNDLRLSLALSGPPMYSATWQLQGEADALCIASGMEQRLLVGEFNSLPASPRDVPWPFRVTQEADLGHRVIIVMPPDVAVKMHLAGSAAQSYERWVTALERIPSSTGT
jgi:hypothetical protein